MKHYRLAAIAAACGVMTAACALNSRAFVGRPTNRGGAIGSPSTCLAPWTPADEILPILRPRRGRSASRWPMATSPIPGAFR